MNAERWKKIEELFESAIARQGEAREKFLDRECAGDTELRKEVESLLAHQQPTGRLIPTLIHEAARLLPQEMSITGRGARFIPGTVIADRYRIIGLLGKGGMGEVYRADDLKLSQPVALKFLPEKLVRDKAMLERFHREVRVARQISHPNVCRVFDIGEIEDQPFLSMEYIDGEDLATLLRRIGRLPADKAVEIAGQLCGGLAAAHGEGVLHRDLKPANVMIDGRGRAKITDFGLAGLASEFTGADVRAGTPAYMAPEQLAGKEVSVRSDIYALGLVFYELFTGRKVFVATTLDELMRLQESSSPPSISEHVKDVDPLVERVILRCLERDPQSRPSSATQVAAALPGGDPLAAAIAAGETPSPEMVAAAPKEGALRPAIALTCLVVAFIQLAFILILGGKLMMHNAAPLEKSPEIFAERAENMLQRFGYTNLPADRDYGINEDASYPSYGAIEHPTFNNFQRLKSAEPSYYYFWYRQSPRTLEPRASSRVTLTDPPLEISGMAHVLLDARGRLVEFYAVPPQVAEGVSETTKPDWGALFAEANLDITKFIETESTWLPPTYADTRIAWLGTYREQTDIPIRIEAASYRGQPVYFQIIPPWGKPIRQEEVTGHVGPKAAGAILAGVFFALLFASVFIARRNLRSERGDRKGAFKIAAVVFTATFVGQLLGSDHVPTLGGELNILYSAITWPFFTATFLWLFYIALEPAVRRRWPNVIISWSRFLAGDWRDPMVGRDVLVGSILGFGHTLTIYSMYLLSNAIGTPTPPINGADPITLLGVRGVVVKLLIWGMPHWVSFSLGFMLLILLAYILLRSWRLAAMVLWLVFASVEILAFASSGPLVLILGPLIITTLGVFAIARFGMLTTLAFQGFFDLSFHFALTPNLSSWYTQPTFIIVPLFIAIILYSFYISLAGQPVLRNLNLHD
jgi:tRNA A-37 threonylcarbamoyl transferase component Bud32